MAFVRPATPFVARSAELIRLAELAAEAAGGDAAAVLLSGDAGVGKTSLITESARRAAAAGLLVLLGRCVDLGTGALPYLPFAEALSQLVRAGEAPEPGTGGRAVGMERAAAAAGIVREVAAERAELGRIVGLAGGERPAGGPGDASLERLALFEALTHTLGRLGDEVAPVLLVLEDLHWADPATRDLVRFLLARLGTERLLVIASYRAEDLHRRHPLRPLLAELARLPRVERMELKPFDPQELADFLAAVRGGRVPPAQLQRIAARSAGNAYYAEELLAAGDDELPAALADVLLDRVERLAPPTQQLLKLASAMGNARIEDAVLRPVAAELLGEGGPEAVEAALREAVAHQALVPDGEERYDFRHALLQEAIYADLLPGERVRLHAALARHLAASAASAASAAGAGDDPAGSQAAQLARHAYAAHDLPTALAASLAAGREAARHSAPGQALELYEQALQLWGAVPAEHRPPGRDEVEVGLAAAAAAGTAGLHDRAVQLGQAALAQALAQPGRPRVPDARVALAGHLYAVDRAPEARELAGQVITELEELGPQPAGVLARAMKIRVDLAYSEPEAALEVLPRALAEAEELGLAAVQAELLTSLATAQGMIGRPGVEQQLLAARAAAERSGDRATLVRVIYNIALDRNDLGDLAGSALALQEGIEIADASGLTGSLYGAQCRSLLITTRWQLGDPEGALAVVEPDRTLPAALARFLQIFALPVRAARSPQEALAEADALVVGDAPWDKQILNLARAEALAWLGRGHEAAQAVQQALHYLDVANEPYMLAGVAMGATAVAALADVAAQARERGDVAGEQAALAAARPFLDDARLRGQRGRPRRFTMGPEGIAWLARLEAEAARLEQSTEDDESLHVARWTEVAAAFVGVSEYEQARARWRLAQALVRAGDRAAAAGELAAARTAATRLGAGPLLAALDDLARAARLEARLPPPSIENHGLTPREREVMGLVAAGLTNRAIGERLFISEKTASVHISNVLAKLGASGRAEAVAILVGRGLMPAERRLG